MVTFPVTSCNTKTQIWNKFNIMHMENHSCIKDKFVNTNTNRFSHSNNVVELKELNPIICFQFLAKITYINCVFK